MRTFLLSGLLSLFAISVFAQSGDSDWSWLDTQEWERVCRYYPDEVEFKQYAAHPEYRVIGDHVYDTEGKLVYTTSHVLSDRHLSVETGFMRALCLRDFENNKYHFRNQSNAAVVKDIINRLRPGILVRPDNKEEEKPCQYVNQLAQDNRAAVEALTILDTTRLDNNIIRYSLGYNDTIRYQETFSFVGNGRYKAKETMQSRLVSIPIKKREKTGTPETTQDNETAKVFTFVEQMPVFPGGEQALQKNILGNFKYPRVSLENGVQGTIMVRFVVKENGSVGEVQILRGLDEYCNKEAKRVISNLPRFTPGRHNGKPVKVWYQIPVRVAFE